MDNIIKNVTDIVTQSSAHSDNMYVCVINEKGERVTSLLLNAFNSNADEVMKKAKEQYPNMTYVLMDEVDWRKFIDENKIYVDGQFIDKPPYVPTPAEVEAKRVAGLNAERAGYEEELHQRFKIAELQGNEELIASIRDEYVAMNEAYVEALKGDEA